MGSQTLEFGGPQVTYLEFGDTCFFSLDNVPPSILLKDVRFSTAFLKLLRIWQIEIGDFSAEVEVRIHYKDVDGMEYETRRKIGADVRNDDCLVLGKIKICSKIKGKS